MNKIDKLIGLCNYAIETGFYNPEIDVLSGELKDTQGFKDNYIPNLITFTKREVKNYHSSNVAKLHSLIYKGN